MTGRIKVKITQGVAYEYVTRDVFPFAWNVGVIEVDRADVIEMCQDAQHYADPASTDMEASTRRIYAAHRDRLLKVLV